MGKQESKERPSDTVHEARQTIKQQNAKLNFSQARTPAPHAPANHTATGPTHAARGQETHKSGDGKEGKCEPQESCRRLGFTTAFFGIGGAVCDFVSGDVGLFERKKKSKHG